MKHLPRIVLLSALLALSSQGIAHDHFPGDLEPDATCLVCSHGDGTSAAEGHFHPKPAIVLSAALITPWVDAPTLRPWRNATWVRGPPQPH